MNNLVMIKAHKRLEHKSYSNNIKIFGYASVFNNKDLNGDIVLPGAFRDSLSQCDQLKLLWEHKSKCCVGLINNLHEDTNGLYIEAEIFANDSSTVDLRRMIKQGSTKSLSIGYRTKEQFFDHDTRYLKAIDLFEISIVSRPANRQAKFCVRH